MELSKHQFLKIIKKAINKKALEYLLNKQGSKGKEIEYKELKMAEYLLPTEKRITILDQRNIFSIRNRMVPIQSNFKTNTSSETCVCGHSENMEHIYNCEKLKPEKSSIRIPFEEIFENDIQKQLEISRQFFKNFEKREKLKTETKNIDNPHVIHFCDPLLPLNEGSNGL